MGRIKVSQQQPPVLGNGVYHKDVPYQNEQQFVLALTDWIGGFVSRHRAMHLVMQAEGFQEVLQYIQHAPPTMALPAKGGPRMWRVHVAFFWGRTSDRLWWVTGVGFHIKDTVNNIAAANTAIERERLYDQAERKHILAGIPARKAYFDMEAYSHDFDQDLSNGKKVVEVLIDEAYEIGKGIAKMPTNPIGPDPDDPWSILLATCSAGVGTAAGETISALENLGYEARKVFEVAQKAVELGDKVRGRVNDHDPVAALADLVEIGLSLSKVAGPFAPLASVIIGSFVEIAIANQAGPVTRVRSHMYVCYVSGVMKELVNSSAVKLTRPGDDVFYKLGRKRGGHIIAKRRYDLQLALMEYALRHPLGEWNLNPMYREKPPFPDAYLRYWSPGMLERSLLVQLCQPKYLYK